MTDWPAPELSTLDRFLRTDPRDVGCDGAIDILHVYADLVAGGIDAAGRFPGVGVHLRACGPCGLDFEGLLAAITGTSYEARTDPGDR